MSTPKLKVGDIVMINHIWINRNSAFLKDCNIVIGRVVNTHISFDDVYCDIYILSGLETIQKILPREPFLSERWSEKLLDKIDSNAINVDTKTLSDLLNI